MTKKYLTRRQVRERYGNVADITIKRWIDSGRIDEPLRIAGRCYFDEAKLDATDRRHAAAYQQARENGPKHAPPPRKEQEASRES
ncbi:MULTISPECIES: DNA-binding protein [Rhizobium]|jgi:predicted site-specific integrase-resolvase|uniref:DNA-binding protein n=1 Tax=Rhizobium TaxID=379 RepID=UPI00102F42CD|nr:MULTISPECIES: DNA-binding protein [Rhizobium]TBD37728.1 DNA-binding protein [Rhizobium ruizarguesonis]TBD42436.1 DNA-binding protein [Rhizobium ruizarguesonis]TBD58783.1 DNA-binding protein [Rhizobium ruizarguesonis]TBD85069.1 DNA-binding protein [Rhizobium ruizarguesonis]TBD89933.1 DNA-binding protein [Rhizobium ruizarguesonis]